MPESPSVGAGSHDASAGGLTHPVPGNFEIGRILHLKSEIRNIVLDCLSRASASPIGDFGFEMQDSCNFKILLGAPAQPECEENSSLHTLQGVKLSKNKHRVRRKAKMKRSASVFLFLLAGCAQYALAQQAGNVLNDQQRLGRQIVAQSCGVCHLPPGEIR